MVDSGSGSGTGAGCPATGGTGFAAPPGGDDAAGVERAGAGQIGIGVGERMQSLPRPRELRHPLVQRRHGFVEQVRVAVDQARHQARLLGERVIGRLRRRDPLDLTGHDPRAAHVLPERPARQRVAHQRVEVARRSAGAPQRLDRPLVLPSAKGPGAVLGRPLLQRRIEDAESEGVQHAGCQLVLAIGGGGVADGALVVGQLLAQEERVIPLKSGVGHVRVSRSKRGG